MASRHGCGGLIAGGQKEWEPPNFCSLLQPGVARPTPRLIPARKMVRGFPKKTRTTNTLQKTITLSPRTTDNYPLTLDL